MPPGPLFFLPVFLFRKGIATFAPLKGLYAPTPGRPSKSLRLPSPMLLHSLSTMVAVMDKLPHDPVSLLFDFHVVWPGKLHRPQFKYVFLVFNRVQTTFYLNSIFLASLRLFLKVKEGSSPSLLEYDQNPLFYFLFAPMTSDVGLAKGKPFPKGSQNTSVSYLVDSSTLSLPGTIRILAAYPFSFSFLSSWAWFFPTVFSHSSKTPGTLSSMTPVRDAIWAADLMIFFLELISVMALTLFFPPLLNAPFVWPPQCRCILQFLLPNGSSFFRELD